MSHRRPQTILSDLGFPESIRWRDGRVWLCDWGAGEVPAVDAAGEREVVARVAPDTIPFSIDWLPDGRLLVVDGPRRSLLCAGSDGTLAPFADLTGFGPSPFNEIAVAADGHVYVNGGPGLIVGVAPDGTVTQLADGLRWPNGMVLIDEGRTLVVADSHASTLVAFDVASDGSLSSRRVWTALEDAPDGICADLDGSIWVASVPGCGCVRVAPGGDVLDRVDIDRGCFSCALGGDDGGTLYIGAAQWRGMEAAMSEGPGQTGRLLAVPVRASSSRSDPVQRFARLVLREGHHPLGQLLLRGHGSQCTVGPRSDGQVRTWTGAARTGDLGFHPVGCPDLTGRNTVPVAPTNQGAETRAIETDVGPCTINYRRVAVAEVADRPSCIATT
ncbi:MAG: SMP-30/gluconolactonase/LRE family protein [Actinobacteria bacterium]|nr:SMP-30/gluconolactonase/LRE family protein [Actinomycetota bacterium]